ncbi:MAG: pyridoxamine 5'-phosphate oxidase family protein [Gammaproteobacteria bacterium]|nr:pyridoxamine 5'-phosphate oxidase family protein [Gammaproteobacteria bacterium]
MNTKNPQKPGEEESSEAPPDRDPGPVYLDLLASMKSLQLASIDTEGLPHCSYTPFLQDDLNFYVFISELAAHTGYLLGTGTAAVMIVADEADSAQIFARTRAYYQCDVSRVERQRNGEDDPEYERLMQAYEDRHGKTVSLLRSLADFHLVKLTPRTGQFVMGFGQAYRLSGPDFSVFTHIRSA